MDLINLEFNCPNLTLSINIIIILIIAIILILNLPPVKNWLNQFEFINKNYMEISGADIGVNALNIKFKPNHKDKEIAYNIWIELSTRKLGIPIDKENDVIKEVYDSWYEFYKITRNSIKEFPVSKLTNKNSNKIIDMTIGVLNGELRTHLTKWQAKYRRWYEFELNKNENSEKSPQEIQKNFPEYEELIKDLKKVNEYLINYKNILYEIIFDEKPKT